ncbi:mersacidin/lichenicidin family type 2 lantibiotic [Candidatus Leptofilum sp.]|uniref:mersacidin/lichenicidin family type 2 lantibiotic n=1 Tax=Candidatus Leptofilum sp. TaxID=3241576 RepID=UPI003B5BE480
MKKADIVRAWKDEVYRHSLSKEELGQLPQHPAGLVEITESEMEMVAGGGTVAKSACVCVM